MANSIMKAYVRTIDDRLRSLYIEREEGNSESSVICSIYKNVDNGRYYCATAIVINGEYEFSSEGKYSGYYDEETVTRTNLCGNIIAELIKVISKRKQLLKYMSMSKELPNMLHVTFNKELKLYYSIGGKLITASSENGCIKMIPLTNPDEQNFLTNLLISTGLKVELINIKGDTQNVRFKSIGN